MSLSEMDRDQAERYADITVAFWHRLLTTTTWSRSEAMEAAREYMQARVAADAYVDAVAKVGAQAIKNLKPPKEGWEG